MLGRRRSVMTHFRRRNARWLVSVAFSLSFVGACTQRSAPAPGPSAMPEPLSMAKPQPSPTSQGESPEMAAPSGAPTKTGAPTPSATAERAYTKPPDAELRAKLTQTEYDVTQKAATEPPFA